MLLAASTLRARIPWGLLALVCMILVASVVNLKSAAQATRPNLYLIQLVWFVLGTVLAVVIVSVDTRTLRRVAYPFLGFVILMLLATMMVGKTAKGSERWLDLGFIRLQPSEPAKLAVILATARFLADFKNTKPWTILEILRPLNITRPAALLLGGILFLSTGLRDKVPELVGTKLAFAWVSLLIVGFVWLGLALLKLQTQGFHVHSLIAPFDIVALPFGLILIQPDLGTAVIVLSVFGMILLFSGVNRISLMLAGILGVGISLFAWNFLLYDYQKKRVETFMNPEADIKSHGYHAAQSIIAIGSGKFSGKGFGEGTQTQLSFLPENHTDVAFAVIAEEWGFLGAASMVLLFLAVVLSMLNIAKKANEPFSESLAIGAMSLVLCHVLINMGMVTGLLPMVGVTLPFVSYGGASMLTIMSAIAISVHVSVWRRTI